MRHDLVLEGRVVGPRGVEDLQVGVSEGKISAVKKSGLRGERRIDATGCLVFPGFIDAHVHMREPGMEEKEDFRTGSLAALHGGVTTVMDMPNNRPPATDADALRAKAELARRKSHVGVLFFGGVTAENLDGLKEMKPLAVGYKIYLAETTGGLILPRGLLGRALERIGRTGRPASVHCEDQDLIEGSKHGRPRAAEIQSVRETLGARGKTTVNICHVSAGGALDAIGRARAEGGVACEATLHHLVFDKKSGSDNPMLRTNPPVRSSADRARLVKGLLSGEVDFLVTDHAPHTVEEKELGAAGVPGLDNYSNVLSWLLGRRGLDPVRAAAVTSGNQSSFFGLSDRGRIEVGARADIAVLDPKSEEKVVSDSLFTKCGWSPYEGMTFPGRARWTVVGGKPLLDDFQVVV